ncbi:hypothetical protein AURDEDRAFT_167708 [Auricularia subglabra TFB-10046 SS5]|nr:hypothetical protein AURDEDRAFT_167708 [Auricularia subglabra TFB-10046 SS5]
MEIEWRSSTAMVSDHFVAGEIANLRGALAQELEGDREQACQSFIVAVIARARLGTAVDVAITLINLAEVADDSTSQVLLDAVMLPLVRFGYDGYLTRALLQSARLAQRNSDVQTARHRANCALLRYRLLADVRGTAKTSAFLAELDVIPA